MNCRHCKTELKHVFADLAFSPISNDMLREDNLNQRENYYPLKAYVCHNCFLVQVDEFKKFNEIFNSDYTYFSSMSKTWLKHTKEYVNMMMERFNFDSESLVVEIASNDGCLLRNFVENKVPVLGVEPTANTAREAEKKGVTTVVEFFSSDFARSHFIDIKRTANLIIGNNVLAHVPDINDFVKGMKLALNENGIITMEFPHLMNLVADCQFDTIYHEHFSYLSIIAVISIFEKQGLEIFDVEEIPTHGGSLRIFAKHKNNIGHEISNRVQDLLDKEVKAGLRSVDYYKGFQERVNKVKYDSLSFLMNERQKGKKIIGYGAASKGNTIINYCGIKGTDLIKFVVDSSPFKQNKYLPGSHIPVVTEENIKKYKPDYVIILPWNLKKEVSEHLSYIRDWNGKFVIFIPELNILMKLTEMIEVVDIGEKGKEIFNLVKTMFPINRSITGNGVRETLSIISEIIPIDIHEIPSKTKVLDWEVPFEWNIKDAWIKNPQGEKIIDFKDSNLHVLNYSIPIHKKVNFQELKEHIFTLPDNPEWIPYRTSYHNKEWGFCMAYNELKDLKKGLYEVKIDSTLDQGSLTYGEFFIKGQIEDEVLISSHICHPSLANDNLSGIAVSTYVAEVLRNRNNYYSYRFLFIPGTIGSITWLSLNENKIDKIKHGLVLTLLGDNGKFNYKKSRRGNTEIDKIVDNCLRSLNEDYGVLDFSPYGYDERQFCSPGYNLPVGRLSRSIHGEFPEYHTSADNLDFISSKKLEESFKLILKIIENVEGNKSYLNLNPKGEPQLGKRGLFKKIGGQSETKDFQMALLWVLNQSDGENSLLDISIKSKINFNIIKKAAESLMEVDILKEIK